MTDTDTRILEALSVELTTRRYDTWFLQNNKTSLIVMWQEQSNRRLTRNCTSYSSNFIRLASGLFPSKYSYNVDNFNLQPVAKQHNSVKIIVYKHPTGGMAKIELTINIQLYSCRNEFRVNSSSNDSKLCSWWCLAYPLFILVLLQLQHERNTNATKTIK